MPMKESSKVNVDDEVKRLVDHFYNGNQFEALIEFKNLRKNISSIASNANKTDRVIEKQYLDVLYKYDDIPKKKI